MKLPILFSLFTLAFGLLLAACGTSSTPTVAPTALPPTNAPAQNNANAANCATENHAPFDSFRSDPAAKLTASTKPKLLEFWAVW
jgi:hypothetical protein